MKNSRRFFAKIDENAVAPRIATRGTQNIYCDVVLNL